MKDILTKIYNQTTPSYRPYKTSVEDNEIKITFIDGAKVEILGDVVKDYEINFVDDSANKLIYNTTIKTNMWSAPSLRYFVNWRIEVKCDGKIVRNEVMNLKDKKVRILCDTNSMGDLLAFIGPIDEFQKKHSAEVDCIVFNPNVRQILENSYKNIKFLPVEDKTVIYYAGYKIGYFFAWNEGSAKQDPRSVSLAVIASSILGLGEKEIKPSLKFERAQKQEKKYVCIGTQSTAQCKYWNRPNGWEEIVKYLNSFGYEVWCIDKFSSFGSGEFMNNMPIGCVDKTGEISLEERMKQLSGAEFFIGIGSGLSWLAWSVGIPVIMISGFSKPWAEFYTPYRVINENVCNGCWNDISTRFDMGNWKWCPREKNFECSKEIHPSQVVACIDRIIKQEAITIITSHANTEKKQNMLIDCINSIHSKVGTKIILSSNTSVPEHIQKLCDYVVSDKENPKLESSEYSKYGVNYFYWHADGTNLTYRQAPFDYGYAVFRMLKNAVGLAKGLGYRKVHVLDYDYEPNDTIFSQHSLMLENSDAVFYKFDNGAFDNLSAYLGAFFSAKTEELSKLLDLYKSKDEYYSEVPVKPLNLLETQLHHLANNKMKLHVTELRESELKGQIIANKQVQAYEDDQNLISYWRFDETQNKLSFALKKTIKSSLIILREKTTNLQCYRWEANEFAQGIEYYVIPTFSAKFIDTDFSGFIFEVYQEKNLIFVGELVVRNSVTRTKIASAKFHFDKNVAMNINDNFYVQHLDFCENKFLNNIISAGDVVVDIGASCGTFANACLMRGAEKVVCLEPSPSFNILSKTFGPEVVCINSALSTKDEDREFFFTNYTTLNTFHIDSQLKTDSEDLIRNPTKSIVKCITLDTLFKQTGLSNINVLKMDIEGHEYEIFDNINLAALSSVQNILVEFHHNDNKQVEKITSKLQAAGFSFDYRNIKMESEDTSNSLRGVIHGYKNK